MKALMFLLLTLVSSTVDVLAGFSFRCPFNDEHCSKKCTSSGYVNGGYCGGPLWAECRCYKNAPSPIQHPPAGYEQNPGGYRQQHPPAGYGQNPSGGYRQQYPGEDNQPFVPEDEYFPAASYQESPNYPQGQYQQW